MQAFFLQKKPAPTGGAHNTVNSHSGLIRCNCSCILGQIMIICTQLIKPEFDEVYLMKYMTFNSSCSYAGIANMLEQYGIETDDKSIAVAMNLPFLFSRSNGVYLSGPMLQTAEWFDLYLNPIGYQLIEKAISADCIAEYLKKQKTAMLGISLGETGKHAIVYTGTVSDSFVFINNKWENDSSPSEIRLSTVELQKRIESEVIVATLQPISPKSINFTPKFQFSISVLQENLGEIIALCDKEETVANLRSKLNTLFRPLFLDGITMLNLIGETNLAKEFAKLQQELLGALRQEPQQKITLKEYLSTSKLQIAVEAYIQLIMNVMNQH